MADKLNQVAIRMVKQPPLYSDMPMSNPEAAIQVMSDFLSQMDRELFCIVNLQADLKPINMNIVSAGCLNEALAHPREIMKTAILSNANSMMLFHNHPSGTVTPSEVDIRSTARLQEVGTLMGIPLTDHIIVGKGQEYYSFKEKDVLPVPRLSFSDDLDSIQLGKVADAENVYEAVLSKTTPLRKVFLPRTVAYQLIDWKKEQDKLRDVLGNEYIDYNLVMATTYGLPIGNGAIRKSFNKLIKEHNLPPVVFHSLRHTSVTYKLKLNGGDIKAVQGDSGHSQINMVTDVYSHIIDDDRRRNAEMFEDAFYGKKDLDPQLRKNEEGENIMTVPEGVDPELLAKVLANPEMAALLSSIAKNMK